MIAIALAALLSIIPYSPVIEDHACVYELNHFYDADGNQVFSQRIWYDDDGMVVDWRMVKRPGWRDGNKLLFWDKDGLRRVTAISEIETWSQVDYDLEARGVLPQTKRRELGKRP